MTRVLVTGMSGTGKNTLLEALRQRRYLAIDTDYDGWELPDGSWDEPRMAALLAEHHTLVISGTVANQGNFYDQFDHVVLLSASLDVLLERVTQRTDNPYGKSPEHRDEIAQYLDEVEPLLRLGASTELDGRRPVSELADCVQALLDQYSDLPTNRTELNSSR